MNIGIFVSDLDGTLLNGNQRISRRTAETIKKSQSMGIRWIIATGRSWGTVYPLLEEAGLKTDVVLLNGAEFRTSDGNVIFEEAINHADARKIVRDLLDHGMDVEVNTDKGDFSTNIDVCCTALEFPDFNLFWSECHKVLKIFAFLQTDLFRVDKAKDLMRKRPGISVTSSAAWNIEITAEAAKKGKMLERVVQNDGVSKDRVVVFGDGENDKSMFQAFCNTCAMGNAVPMIRSLAERVITCNTEDGVAREVERILWEIQP